MIHLLTEMSAINAMDWLRILLLYSHLVLCVFALSAVLKTDVMLFRGSIVRSELEFTAKSISVLLVFLWMTGLAIVFIDTGFQPDVLMTKSKLLIKLMCVCTLTLNGVVLHYLSFPILIQKSDHLSLGGSVMLVVTGALSTSHWLLAAFVGMTRPLGRLPFSTLLSAYCVFAITVIVVSLFFIPLLTRIQVNSARRPVLALQKPV